MAGHNNKKFLFRQPGLQPDFDTPENLPRDIADWLDQYATSGRGEGAHGGSGSVSSIDGVDLGPFQDIDFSYNDYEIFIPTEPGLTALQPEILGIVKQEVKQDPQGGATITVTFSIGPEQGDMVYELRLTGK